MTNPPVRCNLHVDETGEFFDHHSVALLAGLLTGEEVPEPVRRLRKAFPFLPWPLHFRDLNRPSVILMCMVVYRAGSALGSKSLGVVDKLVKGPWPEQLSKVFRTEYGAAVADMEKSIRKGRYPSYQPARELDQLLRGLPEERAPGRRVLDDIARQIPSHVQAVIGETGSPIAQESPACGYLSRAVTLNADTRPDDPNRCEKRYLDTLQSLIFRVLAAADDAGVCLDVQVHPQDIGLVRRKVAGRGGKVRFRYDGLQKSELDRFFGSISEIAADSGHRVSLGRIVDFSRGKVLGADVLTDFVANRAHRVVGPKMRKGGGASPGKEQNSGKSAAKICAKLNMWTKACFRHGKPPRYHLTGPLSTSDHIPEPKWLEESR